MTTAGQLTDRCAGCHRLHSAKASYVLVEEEPALCYTCHGSSGAGSALSAQDGIGYASSTSRDRATAAGALRGGGFEYALLGNPTFFPAGTVDGTRDNSYKLATLGTLPTTAPEAATSAHSVNESPQTAWGSGTAFDGSLGTSVNLTCTSCHDPHGGNDATAATYRILNRNPAGLPTGTSSTVSAAANPLAVKCDPTSSDPADPGSTCTATAGTAPNVNTVTCTAVRSVSGSSNRVQVQCSSTYYPATNSTRASATAPAWPAVPTDAPAPNIQAVPDVATKEYTTTNYWNVTQTGPTPATFTTQMANWCSQCHTRYKATQGRTYSYNTGDAVFTYRHRADSGSSAPTATSSGASPNCIQCHVAHGSNSATGDISSTMQNPSASGVPGGTAGLGPNSDGVGAADDNRLLRADMRGVCAACHVK